MDASKLKVLGNSDNRIAYILDTNVVLHDPSAIYRFDEHIVLISLLALEEIDNKKSDSGIGYNARDISNKLEQLFERGAGDDGETHIPNGKNGILMFIKGHISKNFPSELSMSYKDNAMLAQAIGLIEKYPHRKFMFVTKDRNLRIKCRALGIDTEDYLHDKISEEYLASFFNPVQEIHLTEDEVNILFTGESQKEWGLAYRRKWQLNENDVAALFAPDQNIIGMGMRKTDRLHYFDYFTTRIMDTGPKVLDVEKYSFNFEQAACMAQAMDDSIKIQIIIGKAGTGKTHIAMAAALEKVFKERKYDSIKLIKPIVTKSRLGEDIGFLPGSVRRKLLPKMRPFIEKLRHFTSESNAEDGYKKLLDSGVIELMNLADVRGADIANSFVIFDEAQNANPFQMRTLGTRLGENTKLIVLGDPTQIDSIYLDKYSNGLISLYENSSKTPQPFIARICLVQMVRSYTSRWFDDAFNAK